MVHKQPLEVLKTIEKKFNVSMESQGSKIHSNISNEGIMKHAIDDIFREQILSIWEEDPNTKLSVETVRKKMFDQRSMRIKLALMSGEFVDGKIKKTLERYCIQISFCCSILLDTSLLRVLYKYRMDRE